MIKQLNNSYNVAEFYNNNNPSFIISSNGFIGINKYSNIQERLDIDGNLNVWENFSISKMFNLYEMKDNFL
jgi:hypothetical protein